MKKSRAQRRVFQIAVSSFSWLGSMGASDLNPTAIKIKLPDQIKWTGNPDVTEQAILYGDPQTGSVDRPDEMASAPNQPSTFSS